MEKFSLQHKLIQHAEKVKKAADEITNTISDWQLIKKYLTNRSSDIELNEIQEKKLERYQFIYNQLVSGKYTHHEIVNMLINKKSYGLSLKQALNDMECSKELYDHLINVKKSLEINVELQVNRRLMAKAEEIGDMKAVAQLQKNRISLLKLLPEEDATPAEHFEGHMIEAVFDPRLIGAPDVDLKELLNSINEKRKVKLNVDELAIDIPHEDLNDGKEEAAL